MSIHGSDFPHGESCSISELRIVLLGRSWAGKSSAGNTILGREEFTSGGKCSRRGREESVKKVGEVAGRQVTVVDVQGWSRYSAQEIIERTLQSVLLCSPGPHAFLLVIDVFSMYTEDDRRSMEKYLRVLGEKVWSHTIVLFTFGDKLENSTIEQHIERGGESLQWIVKECGNRYHVLNNRKRDSVSQVTTLLEKIEKMVAENSGCYPSADIKQLSKTEMKRCIETLEEEMEITRMQAAKCSWVKSDESQKQWKTSSVSELRIVLLGRSWAGKTSAGNTILGRKVFTSGGKCSRQGREESVKKVGEVAGRQVIMVDTQGWCGYSVQGTQEKIMEETLQSVLLCSPGPHAFLLVIDVFSMYTEDDRRSMEKYLRVLGEKVWSYTIVLFTFGDKLENSTIERHIERGGESLQWLLKKCGNRYHVLNNRRGGSRSQVTKLLEKIKAMVAENGGCYLSADIKNEEVKYWPETLEEEMEKSEIPPAKVPKVKWDESQKDVSALFPHSTMSEDMQKCTEGRRKKPLLRLHSMLLNKPSLSGETGMKNPLDPLGWNIQTRSIKTQSATSSIYGADSGRGSLYSDQSIQD
ncbi:hypothetical protein MATL_G00004940 [Megalops atlanticus]|uniref:AIG1-type G domain-containing protein n=1 Tax=Megalops atlanticus TaxID=7932 RepID=A0A9D3QKE6_MEGAT|nr:hypothetical protein MATL_G00004940 [Megalops atlanticus]